MHAQQGCGQMTSMHGGTGMMGMHGDAGMTGMGANGVMHGDSLMTAMRFAPGHILTYRDSLGLSPEQVQTIEQIHRQMPADAMAKDSLNPMPMYRHAAQVREVLTPEQRQRVKALPAPCGMQGHQMPDRSGADTTATTDHGAHHRS